MSLYEGNPPPYRPTLFKTTPYRPTPYRICMESYIPEKTTPYRPNIFSSPVCIWSYFSMIPTICRLVLCCRVRVRLMLLDPNSLRHPGCWHNKFHNKLFSLFSKQHTTSLHIVGIMEKYDHIQTGLEKIFGLYGVVFFGYIRLHTDLLWRRSV